VTCSPRISRFPSPFTPAASSACTFTTRPPSRTFRTSASAATNVYGPTSSGRVRNASTWASRSRAISLTWDRDSRVIPRDPRQLLHPPGRHAEEVAGRHDRGQGRFGAAAAFQQPVREVTAGPQLRAGWTEIVALTAAYAVAVLATPAGISGAVLLLPFQVSVLGTPSPAVTPTNLMYNVLATPGALYRYWRQGQTGGRLALVLVAGTLPGVIAGSVIRVELLPASRDFDLVISAVLIPLGTWLALTEASRDGDPGRPARPIPAPVLAAMAAVVGCVGGIYGIGGGSILAPVLIGSGRKPAEVAPAALASTFVTSVAGVITFTILSIHRHGSVAPDWPTGIALGIGGLAGAYTGARLQSRMPEILIRRLVAILVIAIGARYLWSGLD